METYRILLVEDDTEISEMLKNYLSTENYEVVCAFDGQEACAKFDEADFDLVLLDLMIPKISGMGVMEHIRRKSFLPIIILSAKDTESDKTLGLGLGADDYITKPFSWKFWHGLRRRCAERCIMTALRPRNLPFCRRGN